MDKKTFLTDITEINQLIYDENSTFIIHVELYEKGVFVKEIQDYITSYSENHYFDTNDSFNIIGLVPSKEFSLTIDNTSSIIGRDLMKYDFKVYQP